MRERLYKAIRREKQLSDLQMQTQFDMLQAQVNPHFIYNVLNVISSRGSMNDDEVICDICDQHIRAEIFQLLQCAFSILRRTDH